MLGMVIFAASIAQAESLHHHHAMSPFDKIQKSQPLHCFLSMHQHSLNTPCPHKERGNAGQMLRSDCGASAGTANTPGLSLAKDLSKDINHDGFFPSQSYSRIKSPLDIQVQNHPRSIDHPPQLI